MKKENKYLGNKNYQKGRRKEYRLCENMRALGYDIVQRTAGSRSPFDIIAIHKKRRVIKLTQSKPDTFPLSKQDMLMREHKWLNGVFMVEFIVM